MIPIIFFVSNIALLIVLAMGGHYVILDQMTLGEFTAFNGYIAMLVFPIIIIGFMSNVIAQASASYTRVYKVLNSPEVSRNGKINELKGYRV